MIPLGILAGSRHVAVGGPMASIEPVFGGPVTMSYDGTGWVGQVNLGSATNLAIVASVGRASHTPTPYAITGVSVDGVPLTVDLAPVGGSYGWCVAAHGPAGGAGLRTLKLTTANNQLRSTLYIMVGGSQSPISHISSKYSAVWASGTTTHSYPEASIGDCSLAALYSSAWTFAANMTTMGNGRVAYGEVDAVPWPVTVSSPEKAGATFISSLYRIEPTT